MDNKEEYLEEQLNQYKMQVSIMLVKLLFN